MTKTNPRTDQPVRAVMYARYSSDMQNPKSVDDQFRECRREAQRQGWNVVNEFANHGITGARRDRPGLIALQNAVESGDCDIVVAGHRHPEQRTLHRSASLEPSSVCQESAYRKASVAS